MVFFDLPVTQKEERRAATRFRNNLLKDGYLMLQWSVYARVCNSMERVQKHLARLRVMVPCSGSVRVMTITEQQFARMELLVGKRPREEEMATKQLILF